MSGTLPKSWREQKLVTAVRESDPTDEEVIKNRALTENCTPAQLAQITSLSDLPLPCALENFLKGDKKPKEITLGEK